MAPAAPVRAHADGLDVARPQRPPAVQQPPLDQRGVPDQLGALPHQGVHPAQGVLPVVVVQVPLEDVVEQGPGLVEDGSVQVGGVRGA
ncbi:hypothetical protein GCM10010406_33950 [Streptomyces thermolineatus]|uniref:Uncharacterized protein n=1 Tax=Streptomyces thermolineatus TaxID=44033 RepID=A0ABP5Z9M7_9ACTN